MTPPIVHVSAPAAEGIVFCESNAIVAVDWLSPASTMMLDALESDVPPAREISAARGWKMFFSSAGFVQAVVEVEMKPPICTAPFVSVLNTDPALATVNEVTARHMIAVRVADVPDPEFPVDSVGAVESATP